MRGAFYPRLFALLTLVLAACSGAPPAPAPVSPQPLSHYSPEPAAHRGGTLVMGDYEMPQHLHPLQATTQAELRLATLLYAPLWGFDDKLEPYPALAMELPRARVSDSGMTLDIRLRPGLQWSDGQPLTTDDVIYTADWLRNRGDPNFQAIVAQERRSDTELVWHFGSVFAPYLLLGVAPLPKHGGASQVASGPFVLSSQIPGQELVFAPNPHYGAGHAAYLDQIVARVYGSKTSEIAGLLNGDAALGFHLLPSDLADLSRIHGSDTLTPAGLEQEFLSPNHGINSATGKAPPWVGDAPVLGALAAALDRNLLNAVAFGRVASPTAGLFPAALRSWGFDGSVPKADLEGARRTLEGDGWRAGSDAVRVKNGRRLEFSLLTVCQSALRKAEEDELVREWAPLGASIQAGCVDRDKFFTSTNPAGAFDIGLYSNTWGPDPAVWATSPLRSWNRCQDAALDAALTSGASTLDPGRRHAAYADAAREWLSYRCTIPLFDWPQVIQRAGRLHNFVANPIAGDETWNAADWWLNS